MSLFGSFEEDFDDDNFWNRITAMNMQMRSMNRFMNSLMPDPFGAFTNLDAGFDQNALMEHRGAPNMGGLFGFPAIPNMNRLLSADIGNNGTSFCSSSLITMSSGPDGRPQIYQASSSTKTGPGGIRETRRSVQDSVNGVKKMAIGHHIGDRAHIIEKEQDLRSGQLEERQEFINLEEEQAEDFDREFTTKARGAARPGHIGGGNHYAAIAAPPQRSITIEPVEDDDEDNNIVEEDKESQATARQAQRQQSSSHNARRQLPSQQNPQNSIIDNTVTSLSPSSSTLSSKATTAKKLKMRPTTIFRKSAANAGVIAPLLRRIHYYQHYNRRYGGCYNLIPRPSIRTPASSPLIVTSIVPYHKLSCASTPSVHPHPYNTSAARRNQRQKQSTKSHQQQLLQCQLQEVPKPKKETSKKLNK